MSDQSFDPGRDTPRHNEPGAGQVVPGSPVDQDAKLREEADARLAELTRQVHDRPDLATESQRVDEQKTQDEKVGIAQRGSTRKTRS